MNPPHAWISNALEEMLSLAQQHATGGLSPGSAYRVLVLRARLDQARAAGLDFILPEQVAILAERVSTEAESPEPGELLSQLDAMLSDDGDAFGELLDALLAIDDAAAVADSRGQTAGELVRLADAYVSLAPVRTGELGLFAERRLATLPAHASIRPLWDTVARAAAEVAVEALSPAVPAPASLRQRRLLERLRAARRHRIEEDVSDAPVFEQLRAAAASTLREAAEDTFEGQDVDIFPDDQGRWLIQVELPGGKRISGDIELWVVAQGRSTLWKLQVVEQSRRTVIARLGSLEELRERLRAEGLSPPMGALQIVITATLEETPE